MSKACLTCKAIVQFYSRVCPMCSNPCEFLWTYTYDIIQCIRKDGKKKYGN